MLGHMNHMISQLRRGQIRPVLKQEYASICTANVPNSSLLFGDDLVKQLKEAKEASSISQNLAHDHKKNYVKSRKNHNFTSYSPQTASSYRPNNRYNNKAQFQPKKDFWKGQRQYPHKKKRPQES